MCFSSPQQRTRHKLGQAHVLNFRVFCVNVWQVAQAANCIHGTPGALHQLFHATGVTLVYMWTIDAFTLDNIFNPLESLIFINSVYTKSNVYIWHRHIHMCICVYTVYIHTQRTACLGVSSTGFIKATVVEPLGNLIHWAIAPLQPAKPNDFIVPRFPSDTNT